MAPSGFPPMHEPDHTTHFDDCGCKSKRLEAERDAAREAITVNYQRWEEARDRAEKAELERDALRLRVAALEAAIVAWRRQHPWPTRGASAEMQDTEDALYVAVACGPGYESALRAMLVEAYFTGAEDWDSFAEYKTARKRAAEGYADRILGASKEGE